MRFMMLMIPGGYEKAARGTVPDLKSIEVMMKYNFALQQAGVRLALDGLHPPSMGARKWPTSPKMFRRRWWPGTRNSRSKQRSRQAPERLAPSR
jgi:hypothetical protein